MLLTAAIAITLATILILIVMFFAASFSREEDSELMPIRAWESPEVRKARWMRACENGEDADTIGELFADMALDDQNEALYAHHKAYTTEQFVEEMVEAMREWIASDDADEEPSWFAEVGGTFTRLPDEAEGEDRYDFESYSELVPDYDHMSYDSGKDPGELMWFGDSEDIPF